MADERAIAAVLATERCADVHGDLRYLEPCHACRGWAAHVAAAIAARPGDDTARALDEVYRRIDALDADHYYQCRHIVAEVRAALAAAEPEVGR